MLRTASTPPYAAWGQVSTPPPAPSTPPYAAWGQVSLLNRSTCVTSPLIWIAVWIEYVIKICRNLNPAFVFMLFKAANKLIRIML